MSGRHFFFWSRAGCLALLWCCGLGLAHAATVTMTKDGGGNWSDPTLWSTGSVPAADDTVIIAAAAPSTVVVDVPVTVARLEVGTTSNVQWQTVSVSGQSLTVTGDLILVRYGKLYQGPGSVVTAERYLLSGWFSGGSTLTKVAWEIQGTANNRAQVRGGSAASIINVNGDTANGGNTSAFTADQDIRWNYADFTVQGATTLTLGGTSRLQVDHCYWQDAGSLLFGKYLKANTPIDVTNNDFRFRALNPASKDVSGNLVTLRRTELTGVGVHNVFTGNVVSWVPAVQEAAGLAFYSGGGTFTVSDNVFTDIILYFNSNSEAWITPDLYDVSRNLFFTTPGVLIGGAMIQSYYGLNFHDNLLMAQNSNAHIYKLVGNLGCTGPTDRIINNVFDVQDTGADILMIGHSSAEIRQNLFLGAGTPVNLGLTGNAIPVDTVDPWTVGCTINFRRNTVYTGGAASISGIAIWDGETTLHGGTVTVANNLIGDWTNANTFGMASDDYLSGQTIPDSIDWTDYTWWWNANGGTLDWYKSITITDKTEGVSEGFGLHDRAGDPQFKRPSARVSVMDGFLQGDENGDELRALAEFKKRNQNVPGEVFIPQYTVPIATAYLRASMTPMNLALNDSGLDGEDIGAIDINNVPPTPVPPTLTATTPTSLTVQWPEPAGSVVGAYELQIRPRGALHWADYSLSYTEFLYNLATYARATLSGLEAGVAYEVRVRAGNALGYSDWSVASAPMTPLGPPGAPTDLRAVTGDGTATLSFMPPSNTGGVPLTGYRVTIQPGGRVVNAAESPIEITGLTNNVSYTLSLAAVNQGYTGAAANIGVVTHEPIPPAAPELLTLRRAPGAAFEWQYQFATAPTAPGQTCIEGQHAWDDTYLYTCVSGGRWVYVQPNKLW